MEEIANIERRKKINIEQKKEIDETHYSSLKTVCRPIKKRIMREIQTKERDINLYTKEEETKHLRETHDARAYGLEKLINEQHELGTEK